METFAAPPPRVRGHGRARGAGVLGACAAFFRRGARDGATVYFRGARCEIPGRAFVRLGRPAFLFDFPLRGAVAVFVPAPRFVRDFWRGPV